MSRSTPAECHWVMLALVLGACAVGPDFKRPDAEVAKAWRDANASQVDTKSAVDPRWWRTFNDPTLERVVDVAYRQNLDLQVAGLHIVEARAQLGIATGRIFPQQQAVLGSAQAVGLSADTPNLPTNVVRHYGDFQIGFDAVWELDFWGKYRRGIESQGAALEASAADYDAALVSLTAEAARTYVTIRTFEQLLLLAQQNTKLQEEGLAIANARFANGATTELDVAQATSLLETTRATIPQLQLSLQQARNALSTLLGESAGGVEALLQTAGDIPKAPERVAVGVPAELLRRRPDVRSAELLAWAQCARIGVAKADLYPSFSLAGSIGYRAATSGLIASNPLNDIYYALGPTVNWPFLNYGRLTNAVRVEDARFQALIVSYRSTVLKAAQEVEDSLTGYVDGQAVVAAQQRSVVAADRAVQIALVQYREGAADYERVLDAERTLLQQQNSLAEGVSAVTTSAISLYKALGGGWELRRGDPIVPPPVQDEMFHRTGWGDLLMPLPEAMTNNAPAKR